MAQQKVVIMTVPFGGGHHATAKTLAGLFDDSLNEVDVKVIDVISEAWPAFSRRSTQAYMKSTASPGGFWFRTYYRLSDRYPQPLRWFASAAFKRYARRRMTELQPDLVIATFPFLAHVAAEVRDELGLQCPVVTVITDAGRVQGIWLSGQEERILTATEDTLDYAQQRRVEAHRLHHIGFPVAPEFTIERSPEQARQLLGMKPDEFTVLVTAGGLGMNPRRVIALARQFSRLTQPLQVVFVAGKNKALFEALWAIPFPDTMQVQIHGFTAQMAEMMQAADVICTKAGWLTICEALAVQRPLLLFDAIPGHEEENARYVEASSYGFVERDPQAAVAFLSRAARHPELLDEFRTAIAQHPPQIEVRQELSRFYHDLMK